MTSPSVTIYEVAELAGVSVATVSRVVNGFASVSEKTRTRVQRVIDETGYMPNLIARDLTTRRSRTVGLVLPGVNSYFSPAVQSIARCLRRDGVQLLVAANSDGVFNEKEEVESLQLLLSKRVEGAILFLTRLTPSHRAVLERWPRAVPIVLINEDGSDLGLASVLQDPLPGMRALTKSLVAQGRSAVAFIGGPAGERTSADRLATLRRCLKEGGLPWSKGRFREGRFDLASGEAAALELLDTKDVDTLVCANDFMAIGALRACHSRGARVPDDVAVVGYDDLEIGRFTIPALSSVNPDLHQIGEVAVSLINRKTGTASGASPSVEAVPGATPIRLDEGGDGEFEAGGSAGPDADGFSRARVLMPSRFVPRDSHAPAVRSLPPRSKGEPRAGPRQRWVGGRPERTER